MTNKALIRRLQISCLGLDPIDPLRLLVDDVIEALTQTERTWVGLTDEEAMNVTRKEGHELLDFIYEYGTGSEGTEERVVAICKAVEAKLKEKNNA
jgi:hypothetical protein